MSERKHPTNTIGVRREDKNAWERRAPLSPEAVRALTGGGLRVLVESSTNRVFEDPEYAAAGATLVDDVFGADVVLAVKEIPTELLRPGGTYAYFSHTIKGQPYNLEMLRRLVELGCNLVDYECITDDDGRRLVFFGRHAGLAGMLDTLWTLGRRLVALGRTSPFGVLEPAHRYDSLARAEAAVAAVGDHIRREGVGAGLAPLTCGFTGYGNVSQGAQHIWDLLPSETITPADLPALAADREAPHDRVFKVVFREEDLVEAIDQARRLGPFDLRDYYDHPERYRSVFARYAPHLTLVLNGVYWTEDYPRLLPRDVLQQMFAGTSVPKLLVIGDVSCDIGGSVEATVKATHPDAPVYVYDPLDGGVRDGFDGPGVAVMAVDNLPCELPREATETFSAALAPFAAALAEADFTKNLNDLGLPAPVRRALLLHRGRFTPEFEYMQAFLDT